ncbi:MAG: hypothetical protein V4531_07660 [Actinomycetota bacterium]
MEDAIRGTRIRSRTTETGGVGALASSTPVIATFPFWTHTMPTGRRSAAHIRAHVSADIAPVDVGAVVRAVCALWAFQFVVN